MLGNAIPELGGLKKQFSYRESIQYREFRQYAFNFFSVMQSMR